MTALPSGSPRDPRPLLVTSALPYANGPLHFGHVAGAYLPADIFTRYHRLRGTDVLYICGTDEHGVSITVNAEKEGLPYAEYVARWYPVIKELFDGFDIAFDHFARTSVDSPRHPHHRISQEFFLRLLRAGAIAKRATEQHYCTSCRRYLPDRYVQGTCYVCGEAAARGDECKACGSWLEAVRILEPTCVTCGQVPEVRPTMQYELDLSPWSDPDRLATARPGSHPTFRNWMVNCFRGGRLKPNVESMVFEKLLKEGDGLKARPITRDLPWGVPLPATDLDGEPLEGHEGKVLYVWFDAPIGYVTSTIEWSHLAGEPGAWRRFWITDRAQQYAPGEHGEQGRWPGPRLVHFVGKDNIPFHCVVFPAMLGWQEEAAGDEGFLGPGPGERWVLPENVPANEFYNLEGRKFSTSDNWMLDSARMFEVFGVDPLRWYLTVTMPETGDSQFRFEGLRDTVNADLANTIGNYASRVLKFVKSHLGGAVPEPDESWRHEVPALEEGGTGSVAVETVRETRERCAAFFATDGETSVGARLEHYEFRRAAEALLHLARLGNLWFDAHQPWKTRKLDDPTDCRTSLSAHCQILSALAVGLWPFVPRSADALRSMLALPGLTELDAGRAGRRQALGPADDLWRFHELPAGHALGEPGTLFRRIDEATLEAERGRLGAPA